MKNFTNLTLYLVAVADKFNAIMFLLPSIENLKSRKRCNNNICEASFYTHLIKTKFFLFVDLPISHHIECPYITSSCAD